MHPKTCQKNDKAERKSKPNTGDKQRPERQNTSVLNQRERGQEHEPHGSPRTRVQRQKPERTGVEKDNVHEATKHVPPKRRGKHLKLILTANQQQEDRFKARNRTTRKSNRNNRTQRK